MTVSTLQLVALSLGVLLAAGMAAGAADADRLKMPPLDDAGWKAGPKGMRVWDKKEGTGAVVPKGAKIKLHYTGWLTSGKIFDSSVQRDEPIEFGLGQLIQGWQEGVPGMKVGGIRYLEIPYQLAYGERGSGPIPPKATLIFEIEVLDLK